MKPTLDEHIQRDPRILSVYLEARGRYAQADLLHHNFTHVLEKAGLVFLIWGGKVIGEFNESIDHFLKREIADRGAEAARGFYTRKARKLDGGRLEKVRALFVQIQKEINEERPDYAIVEGALWQEAPPRILF